MSRPRMILLEELEPLRDALTEINKSLYAAAVRAVALEDDPEGYDPGMLTAQERRAVARANGEKVAATAGRVHVEGVAPRRLSELKPGHVYHGGVR